MMEVVMTTGAVRLTMSNQIVTTSKPTPNVLQTGCPSCRTSSNLKALKGKNITFHGLAHPKLIWGFLAMSLTTKCCWLPWGGDAKSLASQYPI